MSRRAILALVILAPAISASAGACTSFEGEPTQDPTDGGVTTDGPPIDPPSEASPPDGATLSEAGAEGGIPTGMVLVAGVAKPYFIDATEVKHGAYATFLTASPPFASDARCTWKTGVTVPVAALDENLPVVGVDWCDALFYCKSVGKRLCGAMGGGTLPPAQVGNGAVSQWLFAFRCCRDL